MKGKGIPSDKDTPPSIITWKDIGSIFQNLNATDKNSWCIENKGASGDSKTLKPDSFFAPEMISDQRAYCSFLVQKDKTSYQSTLDRLPLPNLGTLDRSWVYEPCLWIFFGRNPNGCSGAVAKDWPLEGRVLHTDSVSHDGTWHYQTSGVKEWYLTPSLHLLQRHWKTHLSDEDRQRWSESSKVYVPCHEGDVIVLNTRLWFHRTVIPSQEFPSVSYARDFRLDSPSSGNNGASATGSEEGDCMTNVDGLYAKNDIEVGTVIFTEKNMPDCELHRSNDNPNCEVVELDDGNGAVVSSRAITAGEIFCVPESGDEDDDCDEEDLDEDE